MSPARLRSLPRGVYCRKPIGIDRRPGHVAVQVGRAIRPPYRSSFAQPVLRGVDRGTSGFLRDAIVRALRRGDAPPAVHQRRDEVRPLVVGQSRIRRSPKSPAYDDVTAIRRRQWRRLGHETQELEWCVDCEDDALTRILDPCRNEHRSPSRGDPTNTSGHVARHVGKYAGRRQIERREGIGERHDGFPDQISLHGIAAD